MPQATVSPHTSWRPLFPDPSSGTTATSVNIDGDTIDVVLSLSDQYSKSVESLKNIMVTGSSGLSVPIYQIADFESDNSPVAINKTNQKVVQNVEITLKDGADITAASDEIYGIVDQYDFPDGIYYSKSGIEQQLTDAFSDLLLALVVAILLVYIVLAAQFESFILPVMVMMSIPFAMSGALPLPVSGWYETVDAFLCRSDHVNRHRRQQCDSPGGIYRSEQRIHGT